jgi:hypothetical protein
VTPANTICSIGAFTPNPLRADGEVHREAGADTDQVGGEVVHAESDQKLDHDHVDRQRGETGQAVVGEALKREVAAAEGPQLVQDVVGDQRELDRRDRGRQQWEPEQPVQHEQRGIVDEDTTDPHGGEAGEPV